MKNMVNLKFGKDEKCLCSVDTRPCSRLCACVYACWSVRVCVYPACVSTVAFILVTVPTDLKQYITEV